MADEQFELRRVNWTETFNFTQIFKSFRMSVHLSKLLLAFAAIVVVCISGWVLDGVWGVGNQYVQNGEIAKHAETAPTAFAEWMDNWEQNRLDNAAILLADVQTESHFLSRYRSALPGGYLKAAFNKKLADQGRKDWTAPSVAAIKKGDDDWSGLLNDAKDAFGDLKTSVADYLDEAEDQAELDIEADTTLKGKEARKEARDRLKRNCIRGRQILAAQELDFVQRVRRIHGEGIFASLFDYEMNCLDSAITAVRYGNFTGGLAAYRQRVAARKVSGLALPSAQPIGIAEQAPLGERPGFLVAVLLGWHGLVWLFAQHWIYALVLSLVCLLTAALFGGAISRIAALHFAREEKISMFQALRFSWSRFFSFVTAPLIPLALVFFLALVLALGGLAFGTWGGGIILGILFVIAIVLGLIIAFLVIGLVAGGPLMYPTIAVEGSDSFDAMSRSFSYVFARPWRAIFYGVVALVYGVLTYLFVRLFAFLALASTHCFLRWGIFGGGQTLGPDADKLSVIWQAPTYDSLFGPFNWTAMSNWEATGAFFVGLWVFAVAAMVGAYLLSYLASSTTVIYFLLRRKVDATDLDDVYVEEAPQQSVEPEQAAPAAPAAAAETPPAPQGDEAPPAEA